MLMMSANLFSALGMFIEVELGLKMRMSLILHRCVRQGNLAPSYDRIFLSFHTK